MRLDNLEGVDFNKDRSYENWCKYKRQRNFCVDLLRITKRNFFKNLNKNKISDTRTLRKLSQILDYITGFRKSHGSQHYLAKMLENWNSALDKSESVCALFMDFSKAFDTINHDLLLTKLKTFLKMHWL